MLIFAHHFCLSFSLTTSLFLWIYPVWGYLPSAAVCFVASLAVLLALAFVYQRYVESSCNKLQNKLFKALEEKTE
ncbi:MAG: hypothetical protein IJ329_03250 [Clostridia bacterium]|nr:hypothetical protein [Clostridia bacterium]